MATPTSETISFALELSPAQVVEVWNAKDHASGIKLLARIASLPDFDDEPSTTIWVEFMYQTLLLGKESKLTAVKTVALFGVVNTTHAANVEAAAKGTMTKQACLRFFADQLLTATKAMAPADRFTVAEVRTPRGGTSDPRPPPPQTLGPPGPPHFRCLRRESAATALL